MGHSVYCNTCVLFLLLSCTVSICFCGQKNVGADRFWVSADLSYVLIAHNLHKVGIVSKGHCLLHHHHVHNHITITTLVIIIYLFIFFIL